jgi:Icc-related predicted phosphoesterase
MVGDVHGHWLELRGALLSLHARLPLDLVIQVGDAQPIRSDLDLTYMPVPDNHRHLGNFNQVEEPWPIPTWFIGGNHEPFNLLESMPEGGRLMENLEYLGRVFSRKVGSIRISGMSGIFSPRNFDQPREPWPFPTARSKQASYFRRTDLQTLSTFGRPDVLVLHEWPPQMEAARTPDWPKRWTKIGCEAIGEMVESMKPRFVFCGHMHYKVQCRLGNTTLVALDNFSSRPERSIAVLESDDAGMRILEVEGL